MPKIDSNAPRPASEPHGPETVAEASSAGPSSQRASGSVPSLQRLALRSYAVWLGDRHAAPGPPSLRQLAVSRYLPRLSDHEFWASQPWLREPEGAEGHPLPGQPEFWLRQCWSHLGGCPDLLEGNAVDPEAAAMALENALRATTAPPSTEMIEVYGKLADGVVRCVKAADEAGLKAAPDGVLGEQAPTRSALAEASAARMRAVARLAVAFGERGLKVKGGQLAAVPAERVRSLEDVCHALDAVEDNFANVPTPEIVYGLVKDATAFMDELAKSYRDAVSSQDGAARETAAESMGRLSKALDSAARRLLCSSLLDPNKDATLLQSAVTALGKCMGAYKTVTAPQDAKTRAQLGGTVCVLGAMVAHRAGNLLKDRRSGPKVSEAADEAREMCEDARSSLKQDNANPGALPDALKYLNVQMDLYGLGPDADGGRAIL